MSAYSRRFRVQVLEVGGPAGLGAGVAGLAGVAFTPMLELSKAEPELMREAAVLWTEKDWRVSKRGMLKIEGSGGWVALKQKVSGRRRLLWRSSGLTSVTSPPFCVTRPLSAGKNDTPAARTTTKFAGRDDINVL